MIFLAIFVQLLKPSLLFLFEDFFFSVQALLTIPRPFYVKYFSFSCIDDTKDF